MIIHAPNANDCPDNSIWYLLAEISLSAFMLERNRRDDLSAGLLFQTLDQLGISPECVANIEGTLAEFANELRGYSKQAGRDLPGCICVFCQRKMVSQAHPQGVEQALEEEPAILNFGAKTKGGWGYFLIEKAENTSLSFSEHPAKLVDIYLYREGE
jgi:hypothetical protein